MPQINVRDKLTSTWLGMNIRKRFDLFFTIILFLSSTASPVWSASISEPMAFENLLYRLNDQLSRMQASDDDFPYHTILASACENPIGLPSDGDIFREQSYESEKITGLELRGAYRTGTLTQTIDDESGLDSGRGNLELSWDILKNGYRQNAWRAEVQAIRAREADLHQEIEELMHAHRCRRHQLTKAFSNMLINLLNLKLRLMEPVFQVERRAYFRHWSFLDDYLVSEEDLTLTRHELKTLLSDPYHDDRTVYKGTPPIVDIDLAGLLAAIREDDRHDELFAARKEWLKAENAADVRNSLKLYLRKEFDVDSGNQNGDDLVAGLYFKIPLYSRASKLLNLKLRRVEKEKKAILRNRISRSRNAYTQLQEQLRRTIKQHYRSKRAQERMRRTLWMDSNGDGRSLTTAITRMRTLIEAKLELVRAKEELFRRVNEIFLVAKIAYRPDLVQVIPLYSEGKRARPGKRSIYIWSKDFNAIENDDLLAFLETKQISKVVLSAGRKTDVQKRNRFLELLSRKNISAELMVGDNSWIFKDNHDRAVGRSVIMAEMTGQLHFDIEPQAMSAYREHKNEYLELFVDLVKKTKIGLMDRQLSVAVPFHWPADTYSRVNAFADKLYVMAYGTTTPEVLSRRIVPILQTVPEEKVVIVLRADDFKDEWAVEEMIGRIMDATTIEQFAIHDLGSFIRKTATRYETED